MKCVILVVVWLVQAVLAAYSNAEMRQLLASKGRDGVIDLFENSYEKFLEGPRDYHLVVYLASDSPKLNCALCHDVHPAFSTVANSWNRYLPNGTPDDELDIYFLDAEFVNCKKIFQDLQLDSIPKIYHFPPTQPTDPPNIWLRKLDQYQFYAGEHTTMIRQYISSITGRTFAIYLPPNYAKMFMNAALTFAVVMLARKFIHQVFGFLTSTLVWGTLSLILILMFNAGYMFNQIRGTPYVRDNGKDVEYFARSPQNQYGLETQVISTLYGLLGMVFVLLVTKGGKIDHPKVQFLAVVVMSVLIFALYSMFLFVFSMKYPGYPYMLFDMSRF